jgi:putative membrane protein
MGGPGIALRRRKTKGVETMKKRNVVIGIAVVILVLFVVALFVGAMLWSRTPYGMGPGMMRGFRQPLGMHMFGGGIVMVLLGVLVLGGLALLTTHLARRDETPARKDETPLEILKRRYASGEIDREEFERIKESLG